MPRIRKIVLDGLELEIAPMSLDELDTYLKQGRELRDKQPPPTEEEWANRTWNTVCMALNKAQSAKGTLNNGNSWTISKLRAELDLPTVNAIHRVFLEMSGLELPKQGEGPATPTSA